MVEDLSVALFCSVFTIPLGTRKKGRPYIAGSLVSLRVIFTKHFCSWLLQLITIAIRQIDGNDYC